MKKYRIQLGLIGFACLCFLVNLVLSYYPQLILSYYSQGINKWWVQRLSQLTAIVPFSLFEWLIYVGILSLISFSVFSLIRIIQTKGKRWSLIGRYLLNICATAALIYSLFVTFWGINYHRPSLEADFSLEKQSHDSTDLIDLYALLIEKANTAREHVLENEAGVFQAQSTYTDVFKRAPLGYEVAAKTYDTLSGTYGEAKAVFASPLMNYTNITGIYSPFTAEANVNVAVPDSTLLFTTMHEMAHQRGYASENEANFIAFLTCIHHPDFDFNYAGYLSALNYTNTALGRVDRDTLLQLNESLSEAVRRDMIYLNEFWSKYEGKVEETFNSMNQTYLTLNGVEDGVKSYGRVVDLLLSYYDSAR